MNFIKNLFFGDQNSTFEKPFGFSLQALALREWGSMRKTLIRLSGTAVLCAELEKQRIRSPADEYRQKGQEALDIAWSILNSTDNWKVERKTNEGETVYSKHLPGIGKVFKISAEIDFPPKELLNELAIKIENMPKWNPAVVESKKIETIDNLTEVNYQVSGEYGGGLVSGRDFVNLQRFGVKDGCYVSAGIATAHSAAPPHKKYIRAENGPNCWVFRPIPGNNDRCNFEFLLNTKLNGWLPQSVVDTALSTRVADHVVYIRDYVEKLKQKGERDI